MFVHYRTQGFVFKKEDRAEADQLFTVYTKDFGKLEILGKAIRKISSKLRSGVEIFYLSEIEFIQGKTHKTLTDAILIKKFENLKNNLNKLKIAYKISQVLDNLVSGQEPDEKIWQLLNETFEKLNKLEIGNWKLEIIYYYFFWNFVSLLGYRPEINNCTIQGKKINCDIAKIIKVILKKDWQILPRLKIEPSHLKLLKNVSQWYRLKICE
ncbi:MAG: DNA repair protein RecO [Patescibacteria group bacterium]|nr:DNA repair protein RecO [Patescibacteria group bacterium]